MAEHLESLWGGNNRSVFLFFRSVGVQSIVHRSRLIFKRLRFARTFILTLSTTFARLWGILELGRQGKIVICLNLRRDEPLFDLRDAEKVLEGLKAGNLPTPVL